MSGAKVSMSRVLVECISAGRPPTAAEMERLARRVCRETRPNAPDWSEVAVGSDAYRRTMSIVRAAVGSRAAEAPDAAAQPR